MSSEIEEELKKQYQSYGAPKSFLSVSTVFFLPSCLICDLHRETERRMRAALMAKLKQQLRSEMQDEVRSELTAEARCVSCVAAIF